MADLQTWHLRDRTIGPLTLEVEYQPSEQWTQLKRYPEEDFDTYLVEESNYSTFGVKEGRINWVLCGQSFVFDGVEHLGRPRRVINELYEKGDSDWVDGTYLTLVLGETRVDYFQVEESICWVKVTISHS